MTSWVTKNDIALFVVLIFLGPVPKFSVFT